MLTTISMSEVAAVARDPFGMGADFGLGAGTAAGCAAPVLRRIRPATMPAASLSGLPAARAGQRDCAWQQPLIEQQISEKYAHTTRSAAANGGALGPHPARDPV